MTQFLLSFFLLQTHALADTGGQGGAQPQQICGPYVVSDAWSHAPQCQYIVEEYWDQVEQCAENLLQSVPVVDAATIAGVCASCDTQYGHNTIWKNFQACYEGDLDESGYGY